MIIFIEDARFADIGTSEDGKIVLDITGKTYDTDGYPLTEEPTKIQIDFTLENWKDLTTQINQRIMK